MKKTLQEEKNRIIIIMGRLNEQSSPPISNVENIQTHEVVGTFQYGVGFIPNEIGKKQGLQPNKTSIPNGTTRVGGEKIPLLRDSTPDDGTNNISAGFKPKPMEMDEGNPFVAAAHKAKEAGKDSFEVGGKTYKVK
jgi:hypothetical protein